MTRHELEQRRATLVREAAALRPPDGSFADDESRRSFDATMAEIGSIDISLRSLPSETLIVRNPLDPGAPTGTTPRIQAADDPPEPTDRDRGVEQERERTQGILKAVRAARLPLTYADKLIEDGTPLVRAQSLIFDELGRREPPATSGPVVTIGEDPMVHVRAGIENALLHRLSGDIRNADGTQAFPLADIGRNYRGLTMLDTAKLYMQARGMRVTNLSRFQIAEMALSERSAGMHTTSDFPFLLADVANKILRAAYGEHPQTFAPITRRVTLPDFKPIHRNQLGDAPALLEINEHGEFTSGTISEGRETYQLRTYGRKFAITRKALINDDLDAFSRVPMMFGRKARMLEADLVWAQITSNPTMGDNVVLFHATHNNLTPAPGTPISVDALGVARALLRQQTGLDGERLNLSARYLIVPTGLETEADRFVTAIVPQLPGSVNPFQGKLTVIAEPRLDAAPAAWYLSASTDQIDILEIAFLEGSEQPAIDTQIGWDTDGMELRARHDVGAKAIDWRGLYRNDGNT